MKVNVMGNYFEDFVKGEIIQHPLSKTIFESDNNLFSLLTMNAHPLHTNLDYATKSEHKQILVVGTLVFSIAVGLTVPEISGKAIANLEYEKVEHLAPVFINQTIYARTEILELIESKTKSDRGILYVETTAYNEKNIDVLRFRRKVLVKRKSYAE